MFFNKKKGDLRFQFLGLKPTVDFNNLSLAEVRRTMKIILSKFYLKSELTQIDEFLKDINLSLGDFLIQELTVDTKEMNVLKSEYTFKQNGTRLNIPKATIPGSSIYVDDNVLETALIKLKSRGFIPASDNPYFSLDSWGIVSKIFIEENISLANNFTWTEAHTTIYTNIKSQELEIVIVDFKL